MTVSLTKRASLIGQPVMSWYDSETVTYGGEDENRDGFVSLRVGIGSGALPVRKCERNRVAPVNTPIPMKDDRVQVEKLSKKAYWMQGPWMLTLPDSMPDYFRTKRDAVAAGLRRVAIIDANKEN